MLRLSFCFFFFIRALTRTRFDVTEFRYRRRRRRNAEERMYERSYRAVPTKAVALGYTYSVPARALISRYVLAD